MTNLSTFEPFFTNRYNRFFNHFSSINQPALFDDQNGMQIPNLRIDVAEEDKNYLIHADLPGVKKEDIRVRVDGNQITINAEIRNRREERKDTNMIHRERHEGRVFRSFTLDRNIDEASAEAKFADGVLELFLPKQTGTTRSKQLAVK